MLDLGTSTVTISIHAPAQGATAEDYLQLPEYIISIHAPAQGATAGPCTVHLGREDFNPRSRTGSDFLEISTCYRLRHFNPRSRTGSDIRGCGRPCVVCNFNPRSRTGSDAGSVPNPREDLYFNPRSRTGSDSTPSTWCGCTGSEFQSTLPHRERRWKSELLLGWQEFQSTLPHRERR